MSCLFIVAILKTNFPILYLCSIFNSRDADQDGKLKLSELENFIKETFDNEDEHICRQYALEEILRHFDEDSNQSLNMMEFEKGCTSWLNKWSVANKGLGLQKASKFQHIYCICYAYIYVPSRSRSMLLDIITSTFLSLCI